MRVQLEWLFPTLVPTNQFLSKSQRDDADFEALLVNRGMQFAKGEILGGEDMLTAK